VRAEPNQRDPRVRPAPPPLSNNWRCKTRTHTTPTMAKRIVIKPPRPPPPSTPRPPPPPLPNYPTTLHQGRTKNLSENAKQPWPPPPPHGPPTSPPPPAHDRGRGGAGCSSAPPPTAQEPHTNPRKNAIQKSARGAATREPKAAFECVERGVPSICLKENRVDKSGSGGFKAGRK